MAAHPPADDRHCLTAPDPVNAGKIPPSSGWRCILVATMSNLVFKAATAGLSDHRRLLFLRY